MKVIIPAVQFDCRIEAIQAMLPNDVVIQHENQYYVCTSQDAQLLKENFVQFEYVAPHMHMPFRQIPVE